MNPRGIYRVLIMLIIVKHLLFCIERPEVKDEIKWTRAKYAFLQSVTKVKIKRALMRSISQGFTKMLCSWQKGPLGFVNKN